MIRFFLWVLFFINNLTLFSQKDSIYHSKKLILFNYENDLFVLKDRYYTQGVQLTFVHPAIKKSPISKIVFSLKTTTSKNYGLTLEQNCFTPKSITYKGIYFEERPYAGTIFLSHFIESYNYQKQTSLKSQIDIGGIGNCARCKDEQIAIHKATNNDRPLGWEYQLKNDIYLNYKFTFEKGFVNTNYFQLLGQSTAGFGSIYNDLSVGINMRIGLQNNYFKNFNDKKIRAFLVLKSNLKAVGYNATLQGGIFTKNNPYTLSSNQITRLVYDSGIYTVLSYKNFGIEYGYFYITKEFETGVDHGWGKCTFVYWL